MKKNLMFVVMVSAFLLIVPSAYALMKVSIDPAVINSLDAGSSFNVNVNVQDAVDLAGFQFELVYNPDIVSISSVVLSNFLITQGRTVETIPGMPEYDIDNEAGRLTCNRVTVGTGAGASGSGTLVSITFQVKSLSDDYLNIENAYLTDRQPQSFSVANGKLSTSDGKVQPRYHIQAGAGTGGSITPSGDVLVKPGATQCFAIQPAACYHILDVKVDNVSKGAISQHCFNNVNEAHSIQASFDVNKFTVTASAETGGSTLPTGIISVDCGKSVLIPITPDLNYHISEIRVDGILKEIKNPYPLENITANVKFDVFFQKDPLIQASAGSGGKIESSGDVYVKPGEDKKFAITPDNGYRIKDVKVDGESKGKITEYTFEKITSDHNIYAEFHIALKGDIDGNDVVDLGDAISVLQILADINLGTQKIFLDAEVNDDGRIGIEEILYILQKVGGLREFNVITGLRILAGIEIGDPAIFRDADINGDGKIGLEELIYLLQKLSGLKRST